VNHLFGRGKIILFTPVLLGMVFSSCAGRAGNLNIDGAVHTVETLTVTERVIPDELSGFGALSFLTKVDITAPQDGIIGRLYYREGDAVRAGALVLILDNPQIKLAVGRAENAYAQTQAAVKLAQARLLEGRFSAEAELLSIAKTEAELAQTRRAYAEAQRKQNGEEKLYEAGGLSEEEIRGSRFNLDSGAEQIRLMEQDLEIRTVGLRDRDLSAAGLIPPGGFPGEADRSAALVQLAVSTLRAELEAAEAQLEAAAKELESARLAFAELNIYAGVSGTVGARYLETGERAGRGDKILTLIDTESLYAIITLNEGDAMRLQKGMDASVTVDGAGGTYGGTVDLVAPQADSQSFTFTVRILLSGQEVGESLKPGMFARVSISAGPPRRCVAVPQDAVLNRNGDEGTVFVIIRGKAFERKVALGAELPGGEREVLSGLAAGEVIALGNGAPLREGMQVASGGVGGR
jgi:RND family efflux transporter MFP subunit